MISELKGDMIDVGKYYEWREFMKKKILLNSLTALIMSAALMLSIMAMPRFGAFSYTNKGVAYATGCFVKDELTPSNDDGMVKGKYVKSLNIKLSSKNWNVHALIRDGNAKTIQHKYNIFTGYKFERTWKYKK